jgi:UDP-glucose 4-epimerase
MSKRPRSYLRLLAVTGSGLKKAFQATRLPYVGGLVERLLLPLFTGKNFNVTYVPVQEQIDMGENVVLPRQAVEELIRRSSHRVIIDRCTCRDYNKCTNHPVTMGCTLLGGGTREIDPRVGRHVSVEESLEHLDRTIEEGLIPLVGRLKIDNFIWGVRDRGRLLTICHCCPCCCVFFNSGRFMPEKAVAQLVSLQGVKIVVDTGRCAACGTCVDTCFVGALSMLEGAVARDESLCKGCGVCVSACPEKAMRMDIADMDAAIGELVDRVTGLVDIG